MILTRVLYRTSLSLRLGFPHGGSASFFVYTATNWQTELNGLTRSLLVLLTDSRTYSYLFASSRPSRRNPLTRKRLHLKMYFFKDINECAIAPKPCQMTCENTDGGYMCGCVRGYILNRDNSTCRDVDECASGTHTCQQKCVNTNGSYDCDCNPGYKQVKDHCLGNFPICTSISSIRANRTVRV